MRTLFALFVGCVLAISASVTFAAEPRSSQPDETWREARVRPQDPRLVELIRTGVGRSATLRDIVRRLEAGNLIVYISLNPAMKSNLAGKLTWMTRSGIFRYVKVTINTEQSSDAMIATLAHELHHALEVGGDDSVIDQRSLAGLYKRPPEYFERDQRIRDGGGAGDGLSGTARACGRDGGGGCRITRWRQFTIVTNACHPC
jgi:hypothetical protein